MPGACAGSFRIVGRCLGKLAWRVGNSGATVCPEIVERRFLDNRIRVLHGFLYRVDIYFDD